MEFHLDLCRRDLREDLQVFLPVDDVICTIDGVEDCHPFKVAPKRKRISILRQILKVTIKLA